MTQQNPPTWKLVLWPAVITFAITILRLVGELMNWSPALFGKAAGGGGALVGISWLPPVFAIFFALRLVKLGFGPASGGRAVGLMVAGVVATIAINAGASAAGLVKEGEFSITGLAVFTLACVAGAAIAWSGWPALGRTLLAYALAARIPVLAVMLVAMIANWKTHYDVSPPGTSFDQMPVLQKWFMIGVIPQLTVWLGITVLFGAVTGAIAGAIAIRGRAESAARAA